MKKDIIFEFYSKYKLLIFPIVVAISSLILIAFVILPQTIKLITNQKTGDEALQRTQFLEVKAQTLEGYDEEDLSKKVNFALNIYPPDKDFGNIIGFIQTIVSQAGFSIASLALGGGSTQTGAQSYGVTLELAGPKALMPALLSGFENAPRLMKVGNITISPAAGAQGVQVSLGLVILYQAVPQNFGSVDSPLSELSQKDQDLLVKLARTQPSPQAGGGAAVSSSPRGKENPFE